MISAATLRGLEKLKTCATGYWGRRIAAELHYLAELWTVQGGEWLEPLERAVANAGQCLDRDEALTADVARRTEETLSDLTSVARSYRILCIGHAHIDMNWQWSYAETVAVTRDTFRTVIGLMEEYPEFRFSQSQASVYEIVERYDPALLGEIRRRVRQGQWEVAASTWVEADKNLPGDESQARHVLYTRRYLSQLLGIDPVELDIDFEPDTFGHSRNVPEILAAGGVRYYYLGRGFDGPNVFVWEAPSGRSVLAYREPRWYNLEVKPDHALGVPGFCAKNHIRVLPLVYGVGDHGGGPTRRDLERIRDMSTWPLFPVVAFSTLRELFVELERARVRLPVVREELNFMFAGCYASQSRIKSANLVAESRLYEAEVFGGLSAAFAGGGYNGAQLGQEWRKLLFNQFHDILPGTGIPETREYALAQVQEIMAAANTQISLAFECVASRIGLISIGSAGTEGGETQSEGAGVGFRVSEHALPQVERGRGTSRAYVFFNPMERERREVTELTVWDWPGDEKRLRVRDHRGQVVEHQLLGRNLGFEADGGYAQHTFLKLLVDACVPALGYAAYLVDELEPPQPSSDVPHAERTETPDVFVLENELVRAELGGLDMSLLSYREKTAGREHIDRSRGGGAFRLVMEDGSKGLTSWFMGRHMAVTRLGAGARVREVRVGASLLRQWVRYALDIGSASRLKVVVRLDRGDPRLFLDVECHWHERGSDAVGVPHLGYAVTLAYPCARYRYAIPGGAIDRDAADMERPATGWIVGLPSDGGSSTLLLASNLYSYRGHDDTVAATLLRSSYEPDLSPEDGVHRIGLVLCSVSDSGGCEAFDSVHRARHPMAHVSASFHPGPLPPAGSLCRFTGDGVRLTAVKLPEDCRDGSRLVFRLNEVRGLDARVSLTLAGKVREAYLVDLNEVRDQGQGRVRVTDDQVEVMVPRYGICTLCVVLDGPASGVPRALAAGSQARGSPTV